jgi:hypothetical protein
MKRLRWQVRTTVWTYPAIYLPVAGRLHPGVVLAPDSELVIDGFTRSAVSFAVIAFQMAQPRPIRVGHTLHAPAHFIQGAKRGLPCLATIRDPKEVALSAVVREPHLALSQALRSYARFYEAIKPLGARVLVADFADVTKDFGAVIQRLNERFGTRFAEFEHTPENVEECFNLINARGRRGPHSKPLRELQSGLIGIYDYRRLVNDKNPGVSADSPTVQELRVGRPSEERGALKNFHASELQDVRLRGLLARADDVYRTLTVATA